MRSAYLSRLAEESGEGRKAAARAPLMGRRADATRSPDVAVVVTDKGTAVDFCEATVATQGVVAV